MEVECYNNQTGQFRTIPISDTDKFIMFSPDDWGLVLIYLEKLERRIRNKGVKREIRKLRISGNKALKK